MPLKKNNREQRIYASALLVVAYLFFHSFIGANYRHDDGSEQLFLIVIMVLIGIVAFVRNRKSN
jgi:hypothetical protein